MLRTLASSPARDAVKIRCRSRRTSSSTARQSIASQSRRSPSDPFTPPPAAGTAVAAAGVCVVVASNVPIGCGGSIIVSSQTHLTHVSALSGPSIGSYPASYAGPAAEELHSPSRLPVALSAAGVGFLGHPAPAGEWDLPHGRPAGPHRGCHVAHAQDATGQGAPLTPGTVVRSRLTNTLQPAPAASQRPVPTAPLAHPIGGGHRHEASAGVHLRSPIPPGGHAATRRRGSPPALPRRSSPCR